MSSFQSAERTQAQNIWKKNKHLELYSPFIQRHLLSPQRVDSTGHFLFRLVVFAPPPLPYLGSGGGGAAAPASGTASFIKGPRQRGGTSGQSSCRMRALVLLWTLGSLLEETRPWGFRNGIFHNSIWLEQAAGVYHRESRKGRYQLTYTEAKAVCKYEGGKLATYEQLEAARQIGFHVCAAGWFDRGHVGYPIVKAGANCGFGKVGIVDYGRRRNKSERWDAYCYNPNSKECGGVLTDQQKVIRSPGFPEEYQDEQICYWHVRVRLGQRVHLRFLEFDVEEDVGCLADYLEVFDSYDDVSGFAGRFCGDYLPDDIISTGNVMTLKFLSDASVTAGGFKLQYVAFDASLSSQNHTRSAH